MCWKGWIEDHLVPTPCFEQGHIPLTRLLEVSCSLAPNTSRDVKQGGMKASATERSIIRISQDLMLEISAALAPLNITVVCTTFILK